MAVNHTAAQAKVPLKAGDSMRPDRQNGGRSVSELLEEGSLVARHVAISLSGVAPEEVATSMPYLVMFGILLAVLSFCALSRQTEDGAFWVSSPAHRSTANTASESPKAAARRAAKEGPRPARIRPPELSPQAQSLQSSQSLRTGQSLLISLCPQLVVPEKVDCTLLVPLQRGHSSSLPVSDVKGGTIFLLETIPDGQSSDGTRLILSSPMKDVRFCLCRTVTTGFALENNKVHGGRFANLKKLDSGFTLMADSRRPFRFQGSLSTSIDATDDDGKVLAYSGVAEADSRGIQQLKLNVGPGVDAGLMVVCYAALELLLLLAFLGVPRLDVFPWPTPPPSDAVAAAIRRLRAIGAIEDDGSNTEGSRASSATVRCTKLGYRLAALPVAPRYARMLLAAITASAELKIGLRRLACSVAFVAMAAAAMPAAEAVQSLAAQLPCGLDEAAASQRRALFASFDPNGNAILSLAEVDDGLKKLLPCPLPREVVARAFHAAKAISAPVAAFSNDYIDEKEFHYFVQYLHHYLQLWSWFCEVDTSCDQRVSIEEFRAALPQLNERLPGDLSDAAAAFNEVDADGGGMVLFDEFAHWVLCRGLALQGPGEDCLERQHATELLRQRPNLASADGERRGASRGRSGRRSLPSSRSQTPSAQRLSANRQAAAAAKSRPAPAPPSTAARQRHAREGNAGRPESATRVPRAAVPSRASGRLEGPQAPARAARARSAGLRPIPEPPRPRPRAARAEARAAQHGQSFGSRNLWEESPAAALARGRHSGAKSQAILAGGYDRGYF
ncbi:unnamed protein product [Symbiodinium necroappetens]|uniref:EF-hand domain-containing protein n=1 Tax=Symbiodinium necroappetens TaxID=1628268 RepID=A0A812V7Z0_9DINO|nr:unnamed protein product [Symbiodinium necroappetens]